MNFSSTSLELNTKDAFEEILMGIISPSVNYLSEDSALLYLPNHISANYSDDISFFESFSRVLWGLAPYSKNNQDCSFLNRYKDGIINGTNPSHEEYWGDIKDVDQRSVEMVPVALFLYFNKEGFWNKLQENDKKNIEKWLLQINKKKLLDNNWQCFRIIVNSVLKNLGADYDANAITQSFKKIENFYLGDGWYSDGKSNQIDYYISFGIHYYLLIYAKMNEFNDMERSIVIKSRAKKFAEDYIYWFSSDGSSIPFGRSLTYRFAQVAFWSAIIFADVDVFSLGVLKGLICRNLRWWLRKPIFSEFGTLNLGYAYQNHIMTEDYNSTGSPYWALKLFLILSLDKSHKFWGTKEEPLPKLKKIMKQSHSRMSICRDDLNLHVASFLNGQNCNKTQTHAVAKYEKFVYSNVFGFNISRSDNIRYKGAFDSTLAISLNGKSFTNRQDVVEYSNELSTQYSLWSPYSNVQIKTYVIPGLPWHLRIHIINTDKEITLIEGGFPIESILSTDKNKMCESVNYMKDGIGLSLGDLHSGIISLVGNGNPEIINPSPYTNIINKRTKIPILSWNLKPGEYRIITAVLGDKNKNRSNRYFWSDIPEVTIRDSDLYINGEKITNNLEMNSSCKIPPRTGLKKKILNNLIKLLQKFC